MKQKCPKCGRWCDGEYLSFDDRLDKASEGVLSNGINFGEELGYSLLGKKGKKLGRIAGAFGAIATGIPKTLWGGLTGNAYRFQCPNCGHYWEASDTSEDKSEYEYLVSSVKEAIDGGDYDKAISLAEIMTEIYRGEGLLWSARAKRWKAEYISNYGDGDWLNKRDALVDSALKDIENCMSYFTNEVNGPSWLALAVTEKGWIYTLKSNHQARKWFMMAMQSKDDDVRKDATEGYRYSTDYLMRLFDGTVEKQEFDVETEEDKELLKELVEADKFYNMVPFSERQFIFIVKNEDKIAGCYNPNMDDNINWVFTIDKLPAHIYFPMGHPVPNTLYVAHPAKKGYYLPYEGAEDLMFHDKVDDFCRLVQCLGAVEISFTSVKGKSVSQGIATTMEASVEGRNKILSASGAINESRNETSDISNSKKVGLSYVFQPKKAPYCPDDLEWLEVDPSWKKFVKQRLEGNTLSYSKTISSSETINVSSNRLAGIKSSFEFLMNNVDVNYNSSEDTTFSSTEHTEWNIAVRFKSLDEYEDLNDEIPETLETPELTEAEEKYKDEVLFCLEDDNEITEDERKMLERKRIRLGLSEERASEIESMCLPGVQTLTENEKEYLEIFKEMTDGKEVTERIRRILDRERDALEITAERAAELERQITI